MRIHFDHNATTRMRPEARERWLEVHDQTQGNPSSIHRSGRERREIIDAAREQVAAALGCHEDELLFTSGGTESNNLALLGSFNGFQSQQNPPGLALTPVEHSAVLETARALETRGVPLLWIPVDAAGRPQVPWLLERCQEHPPALATVMAANNELGTLTDLPALGAGLRQLEARPRLHVDAVQALGRIPITLDAWGADLASFSAHKVAGPPGVGLLYKRAGVSLAPQQYGGGQEAGLRPGTEDVAGIASAALAIELAVAEQAENAAKLRRLTRGLWEQLSALLPQAQLLGPPIDADDRLPNTLSVLMPGIDGKVSLMRLDLEGLEVSAGSACASGSIEPSHVLRALGFDDALARSALRLSLSPNNTEEECQHAVDILSTVFGDEHAKHGRSATSR